MKIIFGLSYFVDILTSHDLIGKFDDEFFSFLSDNISFDENNFCRIGNESCSFGRLKYDLQVSFVLVLGEGDSIDDDDDGDDQR